MRIFKLKKFTSLAKIFSFLLLIGIIFTSLGIYKSQKTNNFPICKNCNVIVVDIDILRPDVMPCYGGSLNITPSICSYASKNILFEKHFVPNFWTIPSMVSFLTGLYPPAHQFWNFHKDVLPESPDMPEVLKAAGYQTTIVSAASDFVDNRSFGDVPNLTRGFDTTLNLPSNEWASYVKKLSKDNKPYFAYLYTNEIRSPYYYKSFDTDLVEDLPAPKDFPKKPNDWKKSFGSYLFQNSKKIFTTEFLEKYKEYFIPPLTEKKAMDLFNLYDNHKEDMPKIVYGEFPGNGYLLKIINEDKTTTINYMRDLYETNILSIDKSIKNLFEYLDQPDVAKNTVVIITADHGEMIGEHDMFFHVGSNYNELLHVPLIIHVPGYESRKINSLTRSIDILPTLTKILNLKTYNKVQGLSLTTLMATGKDNVKRYAYSQEDEGEYRISIQDENWKLVTDGPLDNKANLNLSLFNLQQDPGEMHNVYDQNKKTANMLLDKINEIVSESHKLRSRPPIPFPSNIDPETRQEIIKKGYF